MFEIITYGGGGLLEAVLNGVAMFFGASSYIFALKTAATLACIGILVSSAFSGRYPDLKWMFGIILIYIFLFVPKVDVTITDTVERAPGGMPTYRVVGNVPVGLAFAASFTSQMKDYFTRSIEVVFSMPNEINYRNGGPLFAQGIMESGLNAKPRSPNLNMSLGNFWKDCVFFDMALGFYSMNDLAKADDLGAFLSANTAENRMYQHVQPNGVKSFQYCRASISGGALATDLLADAGETSQAVTFMNNLSNRPSDAARTNALLTTGASAMPMALNYLTGMSMTSTQMLTQTTLANSFQNGLVSFASAAEAQEVMQGYAAAKAEAERSISFGVMGKIAGRMLPQLNIIAEALIYAVFPIIGLMCMFPGAQKIIQGYIIALAWIAMWAPLYAIFHFFSMYFTSNAAMGAAQMCDAANACTSHLNMYTMGSMKEAFASSANISGYFATLVPMVSYMLVSRSGAMMSGTVGRFMDGYSQPVGHAATEAAGGNVSAGNVQMANVKAFDTNTAPSNSSGSLTNSDGGFTTTQSQYGTAVQQNMSKLAVDGNLTRAAQASTSEAVENASTKLSSATTSLAEARAADFRESMGHGVTGSHAVGGGLTTKQGESVDQKDTLTTMNQRVKDFGQKEGWSDKEVAAVQASLGAKLGFSAGPVGAGADVKGSFTTTDEHSKAMERGDKFLASDEGKRALAYGRDAGFSRTSEDKNSTSTTDSRDKTATSSRTAKAEEQYQAAVQQMESARQAQQYVESHGAQLTTSQANALADAARSSGAADWKQGLADLAGGNTDSENAQRVGAAMVNYFEKNLPENSVNAEQAAGRFEAEGGQDRQTLKAEGQQTVAAAGTHNRGQVPNSGLIAAGTARGDSLEADNVEAVRRERSIMQSKDELRMSVNDADEASLKKQQQAESTPTRDSMGKDVDSALAALNPFSSDGDKNK